MDNLTIIISVLTILIALGSGLYLRRILVRRLQKTVLDNWLIQLLGIIVFIPPSFHQFCPLSPYQWTAKHTTGEPVLPMAFKSVPCSKSPDPHLKSHKQYSYHPARYRCRTNVNEARHQGYS